jgi:broad specificity phosphatase PhoE
LIAGSRIGNEDLMGHVTLIRHGQASVQGATYDALSPLGHEQARKLGLYWADRGVTFDTVLVGPRQRHAQTLAHVEAVYRERGLYWPQAQLVADLDEHHGLTVLKRAAGIQESGDALLSGDESRDAAIKRLFGRFREIMHEWASGGFAAPDIEPWHTFRARAIAVVDHLCADAGRSAAFTSGGLVSAVVGAVLGLDDHRVIHLSAEIHNTSLTELRHRPGEVGLINFNTVPHLREPNLITRV